MQLYLEVIILVVCYVMTSFAMKSQKYVQMTNSTGAQVCSSDPPSQVLPMFPGGEARCGIECLTSSACPYYQFKSTTPIQCELYNQFPVNFEIIDNCVGFRPSLPSSMYFHMFFHAFHKCLINLQLLFISMQNCWCHSMIFFTDEFSVPREKKI